MQQTIQPEFSPPHTASPSDFTPAAPEVEVSQYLWKKRDDLLYDVRFSISYHRSRERFLDWLDRATKALMMIGGSAAFATMPHSNLIGLGIVMLSALSLVFDYAVRARLHADLARRFLDIESDMESIGERDFDEQHIKLWRSTFVRVEADEPPQLSRLSKICEAKLKKAMGVQYERPSWLDHMMAHFN